MVLSLWGSKKTIISSLRFINEVWFSVETVGLFSLWEKILRKEASELQQMTACALQPLVGGAKRRVRVHPNWLVVIGQRQSTSQTIGCCDAETSELLESGLAYEICRGPARTYTHIASGLLITVYTVTVMWRRFPLSLPLSLLLSVSVLLLFTVCSSLSETFLPTVLVHGSKIYKITLDRESKAQH